MIQRLKTLPMQVAYFLLKNSFGVPKILYTLRDTPTFKFPQILIDIDIMINSSLEDILNLKLSSLQINQASLPINLGWIRIRSVVDLSLPAFLSSCAGVMPLVSKILNITVDNLALSYCADGTKEWETRYKELPKVKAVQHEWDEISLKKKASQITFNNPTDIARMKAIQTKESGAWLHVFPSNNVGTLMDDKAFQISIGLRLGCDLFREFQCTCGEVIDKKGLYPLSCLKNTGKYYRHTEINNILKRALTSINISSQLEPTGLDRSDGRRPDGVTLVPWSKGQSLVWDFTCSDTFAKSYINQTKDHAGAAAELVKKHVKYNQVKLKGLILVIVAIETMGPLCQEGKKWLNEIGKKLIQVTGDMKAKQYFFQRISVALQRGNAASVLSAIPAVDELDNKFYL